MSSIKKNFIYNSLLSISQVIFPILIFPYVSRVLGVEKIGLVSFVESFCRYFILVAALGIPVYGLREVAKVKNNQMQLNRVFSEITLIHIFSTLFVSIIYLILVFSIPKLFVNKSLYMYGLLMLLFNIVNFEWFYIGAEKFKFITIRSLIVRVSLMIMIFFLIKSKDDFIYYFMYIVFSLVINSVINLFSLKKYVFFDFRIGLVNSCKKHFKSLILVFFTTVAVSIYILLDTILLGFLSTDNAVGLYTAAVKMTKVSLLLITSLGTVLLPKLTDNVSNGDEEEFLRLIDKSLLFVITLSVPICYTFLALSENLLILFSGKSFIAASFTMKIMSPITVLIGLSNVFGIQILTPFSQDKKMLLCIVLGTILSLLLNLILIPIYQEVGASITLVLTELSVAIMTYYAAKNVVAFSFPIVFLIKNIIVGIGYLLIANVIKGYYVNNQLAIMVVYSLSAGGYFLISQCYLTKNSLVLSIRKLKS